MTKRVYEAPLLIDCGAFAMTTGLLQFRGRDHILLSKNW
ncbi:keywimysin-related RiPP [Saccharothrix stipae]